MVASAEVTEADYSMDTMHLKALGSKSRQFLSSHLNHDRVLPQHLPSNWIGLMSLIGIEAQWYEGVRSHNDPTGRLLELWIDNEGKAPATVTQLLDFLLELDRWDVYEDSQEHIERDLKATLAAPRASGADQYVDCLTTDDRPGEPRRYHAFILYAQLSRTDTEFAVMMKRILTDKGYSICTQDNLLAGFPTIVGPLTELISDRCSKMIVILSEDFLKSAENTFYMDYAQSVGIQTGSRKIIPCVYRECKLPSSYSFYHKLRYNENSSQGPFYDFWDKLSLSIDGQRSLQEPKTVSDRAQLNGNPVQAVASPAVEFNGTAAAPRVAVEEATDARKPAEQSSNTLKSIFSNMLILSKSKKKKQKNSKEKETKMALAL